MDELLRWGRRVLVGLGALAFALGVAYAGVHLYTERALRVAPANAPLGRLPAGNAEEGGRLARVLGCRGCHDADLGGRVFADIPNVARLVAPNLTRLRADYDEDDFLRLMRAGAKQDGSLALVMPNKSHQRLTDQQLADLYAYLHSAPDSGRELPPTQLRPLGRLGIVLGEYDLEDLRADAPESAAVLADRGEADRGRHLALVACGECHGLDLAGAPGDGTPPLVVAKAYSEAEFIRLMREGVTKAGTESASGLMSRVARSRFAHLTDAEVAALKAFLDRR